MDNERVVLPPEILYEILVNLPVKSLIRFRCVCKSWKSLSSDSSFQQEHYLRCLQHDPAILIASTGTDCVDYDTYYPNILYPDTLDLSTHDTNAGTDMDNTYFSIPFPDPPSSFHIVAIQICRGLACVALFNNVFVCNPATREIITLPRSGDLLPFGDLETNHGVGFGYAASTKEFKVVRFFRSYFSSQTKHHCQVLTLGTSQWREARCPPTDLFSDLSLHAPFFHGAIHFLSDSGHHSANDAIYAFDIESEEYTTIRLPEDYYFTGEGGVWSLQCLNELKGCLCLTSSFETSMHLWLLKDYASGRWVKEYIIDIPEMISKFVWGEPLKDYASGRWVKEYIIDIPEMSSKFVWGEPLAMTSDGNILLKINGEFGNGQLCWYNPSDKTSEKITITATMYVKSMTATMYVESLLSLAF